MICTKYYLKVCGKWLQQRNNIYNYLNLSKKYMTSFIFIHFLPNYGYAITPY